VFKDIHESDLLLLGNGEFADAARELHSSGRLAARCLDLREITTSRMNGTEVMERLKPYAPGRAFMVGERPVKKENGRSAAAHLSIQDLSSLVTEAPMPRELKNRKLEARCKAVGLEPAHLSLISACGRHGAITGSHPTPEEYIELEKLRRPMAELSEDLLIVKDRSGVTERFPYQTWTMKMVLEKTGSIPGATMFLQYREVKSRFETKFVRTDQIRLALRAGIRVFCVCSPRIVFEDLDQSIADCNEVGASIFRLPG